ncbi:unnamed protein product [Acanthoscelides obtectus]|uniref:RING-type domain-containing protein n=1 Tax=Acanthoscelides obtectus TaxID=200917 RepID=A0A9P0L5A2_ACAOB|nr:unnamed protein product [Acanthoscelides obtectus]CAK1624095.1 E3 ubiquitin-protein ligase SHPRH [Acanthoscelides obtectus]
MGRRKNAPRRSEGDIWSAHNYIPIVKKHRTLRKHAPPHKLKVVGPTEECKHLLLGKVMVGTSNNTVPTTFQVCRILFKTRCEENEANDQDTIVLEYDENTLVVMKSLIEMEVLKDVVTSKVLSLSFCIEDDKAFAYVFLRKLPLASVHHKALKSLKTVFKWIFNIETDISKDIKGDLHGSSEISTLYNKLVQLRSEKYEFWQQTKSDSEIHPFLKVSLRPYQVEAVRWMLHRENIDFSKLHSGKIHPLYTAVTLPSGLQVYFVPFSGYVSNTYPQIEPCIRGGILADEMGLGKTVEVLACILLHPKDEHVFLQDNGEMKPIIISAKRKKMNSDREEETYTQAEGPQTTKKIKEIQRNIMKVNPKKTATKIALETWYALELGFGKNYGLPKEPPIQCVCGSIFDEGIVKCESCGKKQHKLCLGYNKKLGEYFCSQCWMSQPLIEIGATLIVTPLSLRKQWISEIRRHIGGGIKVLRYDGCNSMVIYPTDLKNYDIVVTTYNVLQSELRLTEQSNIVNLRRERKYSPLGCPLTRVKWWRICLDEAQTVDAPKKMVSEMARKICAEYRWAVTGTPINKNISDLHGLVDYLQITPYDDLETWKNILYVPYMSGDEKPMLDFLSDVLWRSSKADVYDQINIPKQTFKQHFLEFSAVEKFFYKREHELSCNDFLRKVRNRDPSLLLERIEKTTLNSILAPLLSLRHACTHPNTSRGRYLATKKQLTSMQDLLEALIQKNISDSEECLRLIISSLNGLAGIHLLQGKHREAIGYYRDVLQLRATFSDGRAGTKLPVDKLQLVHTMHNLAEVLEQHPPKQPTLRDELLRKDCIEVEHKYMEKFINEASEAYRTCKDYVSKIEDLENKLILKYGQWYSDGLDWILINDHFNEFLTKIQVACNNANIKLNLTSTSERNIMRTIYEWNEGIVSCRNKLLESLNRLYDVSEEDRIRVLAKGSLVNSAMNCHLRPQNKQQKVKKCPVCLANIRLKQYEGKLFNMEKRKKNFEDMSLMGSWKPSMEELICKTLCSILKIKHSSPELYKDGETHMNVLETMKKEFKEVRHFWTLLDQQICAEDELDICKLRLQLKEVEDSDEGIHSKNETHARILKSLTYTMENKNENMHLLTVHELDYQNSYLNKELEINKVLLERLLGTQNYLETLRKQQYEGQNPDPCPICKNVLENHWSILLCGHSFCLECIQVLLENTQKDHIQCSICRNKQKYQDISYIKAGHTVMDGDCLNIKGNYSTKIEAVIKLLMELKEENPVPKVLLFSSWHSVLKNIKEALDKNEITSELISASSHFEMKIENFKVQLIQTDFTRSWFLSKMLCLLWKDKVVNDLSKKEFMHPRIIEGILQKQNVNLIYVTDMCYTAIC